ncbi:MAG: SH3 domain-containing protein [bacterium]|nr:SH3 domain-containing protein [bacterium]
MRKFTIVTIAISLLSVASYGDAGGSWIFHEDVSPGGDYTEHPSIRMAAENVDIILHDDNAEVKAIFEFENTGAACSVEMVFPLDGVLHPVGGWETLNKKYPDVDWYYSETDLRLSEDEVTTDFKVGLDDSSVDYSLVELRPSGASTMRGYASWPVNFAAGEERVVECSYTSDYGGGGGMLLYYDFDYFLYTGSSWKGSIGYGTITVRPGSGFRDGWRSRFLLYESGDLPPAADYSDRVVWEFTDFEPSGSENNPTSSINVYLIRESVIEDGYLGSGMGIEEGPGDPGRIIAAGGINFRTEPDNTSARVPGHEFLPEGEPVAVLERDGDWYRIRTNGGFEGWVRWRYVDPDTGKENRYIELCLTCE